MPATPACELRGMLRAGLLIDLLKLLNNCTGRIRRELFCRQRGYIYKSQLACVPVYIETEAGVPIKETNLH